MPTLLRFPKKNFYRLHIPISMTLVSEMNERELIEDFRSFIHTEGKIGPGDDAAVLSDGTVASTDIVSFDRHFPAGMTYEQFGWYAAAVSFSDIASMGARPTGFLAALALPGNLEKQNAYDIMSGIDQCCEYCGTGIIGGDTKPGPGIITGTALGRMDGRKPMLRTGARPDDVICVTGPLGGPAAALMDIEYGLGLEQSRDCLYVPIPRIAEGISMAESGAVTSCMDLSDGLGTALNTICGQSHAGATVEWDFLPKNEYAVKASELTDTPLEQLLFDCGGEYELLFTADKNKLERLYDTELEFHVIGMINDSGRTELIKDGERRKIRYGRY